MKYVKLFRLSLFFLGLAYLAHLKWWLWFPVISGSVIYGQCTLKLYRKREKQMERFEQGCFYQEQLITSFLRNQKIITSLEDVLEVSDGKLYGVVNAAIHHIRHEWIRENYLKEALDMIEKEYGSLPMRRIHHFLIHMEEWGGESEEALKLFYTQLRSWKKWQLQIWMQREEQLKKLNLTVILSGIICFSITKVLPEQMNHQDGRFYQLAMGGSIILFILVSFFFLFYMNSEKEEGESKSLESYLKLWECLENKKGLSQERAKLILERDVKLFYPEWLMDMLLRLETETVNNALEKSLDACPAVLQYPLTKLVEKQRVDSLSKEPYVSFLQDLDIPEIKTLMLQMYSIRNLGKQEIREQILSMLDQGQHLEEAALEIRLKNQSGWNGLLAALPMLVTVAMMFAYMTYTLITFLSTMADGSWI